MTTDPGLLALGSTMTDEFGDLPVYLHAWEGGCLVFGLYWTAKSAPSDRFLADLTVKIERRICASDNVVVQRMLADLAEVRIDPNRRRQRA